MAIGSSTLVDSNGNAIGTSATGNRRRQTRCLCGFQTVLIALTEAFVELVTQRRPDAINFTVAYADDCFLAGDVDRFQCVHWKMQIYWDRWNAMDSVHCQPSRTYSHEMPSG